MGKAIEKIISHAVCLAFALLFLLTALPEAIAFEQGLWPEPLKKTLPGFDIKPVKIKTKSRDLTLTIAVPLYRSGGEVQDFGSAFTVKRIQAQDGYVVIPASRIPVFVEEGPASAGISEGKVSPFGVLGGAKFDPHMVDLGLGTVRVAGDLRLSWGQIEPEQGRFDMEHVAGIDKAVSEYTRNGLAFMVSVYTQNPWDMLGAQKAREFWAEWKRNPGQKERAFAAKLPRDMNAYSRFLKWAVERYDGDGFHDASGSPRIDYWQITNEPDIEWKDTPKNLARLQKASYIAIKEADPTAKVVLSGVGMPRGFLNVYVPMIEELARIKEAPGARYFDIFDFHWWVGGEGGYLVANDRFFMSGIGSFKEYVELIRQTLDRHGYAGIPLWITETSTHVGKPAEKKLNLPFQSELQQAVELVKRFVYPLSLGVEKVFWNRIIDPHNYAGNPDSFFNTVGLIHNHRNKGLSSKKLSYFTYKKLIEKLGGSDWKRIERLDSGEDIFAYRFTGQGRSVYVVWTR